MSSAVFGFCKTHVIVNNWRMCTDWWSPVSCNWSLSFISDILSFENIWEYVVLFRVVRSEKEDLCIPKDIFKDLMWYNANGKCLIKKCSFYLLSIVNSYKYKLIVFIKVILKMNLGRILLKNDCVSMKTILSNLLLFITNCIVNCPRFSFCDLPFMSNFVALINRFLCSVFLSNHN